ncbi:MAG: flagellar hook-associated protein FlgL [Azoarcus sp.]|jgi:flagellar hook-associated protein 3 FlgL|nr:flagellar hook-associated protein FlgL [Azoarcus sp.]
MRISTNMIYDRNVSTMQTLWTNLLHANSEVSTGRRVLTPADDPVAAARALDVTRSQSINTQFKTNQDYAGDGLKLLENKLAGVGDILQYVRSSAMQAGDGILTQTELDFIATDMRSQYDSMVALANTQDARGDFLFSGYRSDVMPFQGGFGNVQYMGDQGSRTMQVSATRFMPVSVAGSDVFDNTRRLDGAVNAWNSAGDSVPVSYNATMTAADMGRRYEVTFNGTDYDVVEHVLGGTTTTVAGSPFAASGTPPTISFNGIDMDVTNFTTSGETFEVFASSKNVFQNLELFIDTLEHPGASGVISGVKFAIDNVDAALDTSLRVRAQVGSQLVELEQLNTLSTDMDTQYATTLSRLQDCDYAEAISRLTQLQTNLQAAQLSFMKVSGLSLFNYLS